jgi:hypothetical protein
MIDEIDETAILNARGFGRALAEANDWEYEPVAKVVGVDHYADLFKSAGAESLSAEEQRLADIVHKFLQGIADKMAQKVLRVKKLAKTDDDSAAASALMLEYMELSWDPLAERVELELRDVSQGMGTRAIAELSVPIIEADMPTMIDAKNKIAGDWARARAAEMVGMRRTPEGELVPNPKAEWAISDTTRDQLRAIIEDAFQHNTSMKDLARDIREAGAFSAARAKLIARTEAHQAQQQGNLAGWVASGVVESVAIRVSMLHDPLLRCDCVEVAAAGPYALDRVPRLPRHPACCCTAHVHALKP